MVVTLLGASLVVAGIIFLIVALHYGVYIAGLFTGRFGPAEFVFGLVVSLVLLVGLLMFLGGLVLLF